MELDYKKILGVCFKFVKDEVKKTSSEIELVKNALNNLEQTVIAHSHDQTLPEDLVYESHLNHEVHLLSTSIKGAVSAIQTKLDEQSIAFGNLYREAVSASESEFKALKDIHESNVNDFKSNITDVKNSIESYKVEVAKLLEEVNGEFDDIKKYFDSNFANISDKLDDSISSTVLKFDKDISDLNADIKKQLKSIVEDHQNSKLSFLNFVKDISAQFKALDDRHRSDVNSLHDRIGDIDSKKAATDHAHDQYATNSDVDDIKELVSSILSTVNELPDIYLTVNERESLTHEISKAVQKSLVIPKDGRDGKDGNDGKAGADGKDGKDGKDASEWDITWHPTIRGRLGIKNSKWKDYKWQDLLIRSSQPSLPSGGFIGGGGGSSSAGVISVNGKTGIVNLTAEDILVDSTPQAGEISYVDGQVHTITVGEKVTTILRSGSTIVGVNKGTYTKNFIRNESGSIIGWTIS